MTGASNGAIPASSLTAGADTNANHTIDAGEITLVATLIGVNAAKLVAADLV